MNELNKHKNHHGSEVDVLPDLTETEEARKAFIASEIFNRKY
jgi:hypothetical protein